MKLTTMENNNQNSSTDKPVTIKGSSVGVNEYGNFKQKHGIFVPRNSAEKVAKEHAYYDAKENPARHYNINDQAFSQSSPQNFIKTKSNFISNQSRDNS